MNSKISLFLSLLILLLAACNNNTSDPEFNADKLVSTQTDSLKNDSPLVVQDNKTQTTTSTTVVPTPANSGSSASNNGLNPAHGQPGHRCDIAVGAPLNSKPVTTSTQSSTNQQIQTQTVSTKKTVTPAGMNPPHGEPGHRCDIAVGSPLNQPVKKDSGRNTTTISPIVKDSTKK